MSFADLDMPFEAQTNRFILFFAQHNGDIDKAAVSAHITPKRARGMYRNEQVKAECDRRLELLHTEMAKLEAGALWLCKAKLDKGLVEVIENAPDSSSVKVNALALGYKVLGLISDKVQHTGENGGPMVFTLEHIQPKQAKEQS